tara:strand:+ start:1010 stop:1186 length:177 start_codon:yes stop_codon:yes gene_type:complete
MKKPNKKDYNFNDHFECLSFASQMIKYVDYLECKDQKIPEGNITLTERVIKPLIKKIK